MATKSRPQQKKEAETTIDSFPLAEEVGTYEAHLPEWAEREGQFVLIKRRDVLGFYSCYEEALEVGYDRLGSGPFLVKQILVDEPIYRLGHVELE